MLNSWNQVDAIYPFDRHSRCTEARFRLSFHQGEGPSPNALFAGLDPKAISLAVSAMNVIKICRAVKSNDASEGNYQLHEMIMMHIEDTLINEIAWAPGCLHPYDLIAAACDDGTVRILEVDTHYELGGSSRILVPERLQRAPPLASRNTPSGIGAGLAGLSYNASRLEVPNSLNIKHQWRQVAELAHNEAPVWKVRWTHDGESNHLYDSPN